MKRRRATVSVLVTASLVLAACGGDDDEGGEPTASATAEESESAPATEAPAESSTEESAPATEAPAESETESEPASTEAPPATEAPEPSGWAVNVDDCIDPASAEAPIEGTIKIGSAMPLTGGVAAAAFAPVKGGFDAYIQYANENELVPGYTLELTIEDDQYNPELTPGAVNTQIDAGAHLFAGIIGTPNNGAVRDLLNDECIPQLNALTGSPAWGEVADYPWTTGLLVPYDDESKVYAKQIAELFPDGATVSLFYVNSEFGQAYADAFEEIAGEYGLEILGEQTIEATDANPPTSQVTTIASEQADVVMAVPLGAGCISFLTEMANAKAQNPDWQPLTFITNTCASSLILGAAGEAANGLYTSNNLIDIGDPANDAIPAVAEYKAYMEGLGLTDIVTTAAAGWNAGEATVAILAQAAASPDGLTRESIINAARSLSYTPSLGRPGVEFVTNGEEDGFIAESLQVVTYDAAAATFTNVGELITDFET